MVIAGYEKTSLIEWPGKISAVLFTQGCNFKCPFCHNADLVQNRRAGERESERVKEQEIIADLKRRREWLDAVVVTGGEPTLQKDLPEFLESLGPPSPRLRRGKGLGLLRMVHTNGTNPKVVKKLIDEKLVDYWGMDLKSNFDNYFLVQSSKLKIQSLIQNVKTSMVSIINSGVEYEFRTTVVPGIHDLDNLKKLASELQSAINNQQSAIKSKWYLQQFRPINCLDKSYLKKKPFSKEEMENFQKELQQIIPHTFLRGV